MRAWTGLVLALGFALSVTEYARAGVYNPGESDEVAIYPDFIGAPTGRNFRDVILILRTIPVERPQIDNPIRRRYAFMDELIDASPAASFKVPSQRLQASAVLIRRRKFEKAEFLLRPLAMATAQQANIPVQSNFATALHLGGNLQAAYDTLRPVVTKHWKTRWDELPEDQRIYLEGIGWSQREYEFFHDCDTRYLKLLRLRLREQRAKKTAPGLLEPPDAIFDDEKDPPTPVKFLNGAGDFEAGRIAGAEKAKLPVNALAIVQQLLVWLPDDLRLFWLLGELYNAQGGEPGIRAAHQVFMDLSKVEPVSDDVKRQIRDRLGVLISAVERSESQKTQAIEQVTTGGDKKDSGDPPLDWRAIAVSFTAGCVVALFTLWQVREIQRRRQARNATR